MRYLNKAKMVCDKNQILETLRVLEERGMAYSCEDDFHFIPFL
jgi:hypothetical protein